MSTLYEKLRYDEPFYLMSYSCYLNDSRVLYLFRQNVGTLPLPATLILANVYDRWIFRSIPHYGLCTKKHVLATTSIVDPVTANQPAILPSF